MALHSTQGDDDTGPDAYPLDWPVSWPRTPAGQRRVAKFHRDGHVLTLSDAIRRLKPELRLLRVTNVVISTNVKPTLAGELNRTTTHREVQDPGAAVYFRLKTMPRVLACDRWNRLPDNLAAIAGHIAAARAQDRWGVGTIEQAFAGYLALPAVGTPMLWWQILGLKERPTNIDQARAAWLDKIRELHPDRYGGTNEAAGNQAAEVNAAWQEAQRDLTP